MAEQHNDPFDQLAASGEAAAPVIEEDRAERYFFYAGDEPGLPEPGGMRVQSKCIANQTIRRCQVTPCLSAQVWARIEEIPEGRLIRGSENIRQDFGQYWEFAGPVAQGLLFDYGNALDSGRNWGLIELAPHLLRGKDWKAVGRLGLTKTFFPTYPNIPETNAGVYDQITSVMNQIDKNSHPSLKWSEGNADSTAMRDLYLAVGADMLKAVEAADRYQQDAVAAVNIAVTLPSTEPGYKREFDDRDRLFSQRTGVELAINSLRQQLAKPQAPQPAPLDTNLIAAVAAAVVQATRQEPAQPEPQPVEEKKPQPKKAA